MITEWRQPCWRGGCRRTKPRTPRRCSASPCSNVARACEPPDPPELPSASSGAVLPRADERDAGGLEVGDVAGGESETDESGSGLKHDPCGGPARGLGTSDFHPPRMADPNHGNRVFPSGESDAESQSSRIPFDVMHGNHLQRPARRRRSPWIGRKT